PNHSRYGIEPAIPKRATGKPEHIRNAPQPPPATRGRAIQALCLSSRAAAHRLRVTAAVPNAEVSHKARFSDAVEAARPFRTRRDEQLETAATAGALLSRHLP